MARIRSIKPTFFRSRSVKKLSDKAKLAWIALWNVADDEGRLLDELGILTGDLWALSLSEAKLDRVLNELHTEGRIIRYEVAGQGFIQVTGWDHQRINRPTLSLLPPVSLTDQSVSPHLRLTGGREGIGREGNAAAAANARGAVNGAAAAIAELRTAAIADGLVVRWDKLTNEHRADLHQLVHRHGVAALVRAAQRVLRVDDPPRYANAWIPHWQALPAPGQRLRAVSGTCSEHSLALPCIGCAADAKAVGG